LRLDYIDRRAGLSGKRVLDVGCGGGILSESMAVRGAQVTGIDLAEKPIQVAKLHLLETRNQVEYRLISPEDLAAEAPACYDVVTCMELLEHVPDPGATVSACAQLANPGGHVFFSTLNRNPKAYLQAVIAAEYVLGLLPRGTHEYERFIKPSELARFCRGAKLEVQEIIGMTYHPLPQVYSLTTNTEVNYIVYCQKTQ
jgi:2-polyprenyl-6-hydroxyphenyl methylase/3-demethylubiquinone-9 3-methyltransferase